MPSKTGLQKKSAQIRIVFDHRPVYYSADLGRMSAQLNTRASASMKTPPASASFGSAGRPSPANGRQLLVDRTQVYTVGAGVHARCVFHFFSSGVLPLGGGEIRRGADFRQLIKGLRVHSHHCILCYRMGQQMRTAPVAFVPQG